MSPMLSFTGFSGSGKTTLVCSIVHELSARGYAVATIKHDGHGHNIELSGDSSKHKSAGAACSIVSNKNGFVMQCDSGRDMSPEELAAQIPANCDIIICEGFKHGNLPKIEVVRKENGSDRANKNDPNLIAVATDMPEGEFGGVKVLNLNNPVEIADFIESKFLGTLPEVCLHLIVDGKAVPTKDFLTKMLAYSLQGLIKPLKGCEDPQEITIKAILK